MTMRGWSLVLLSALLTVGANLLLRTGIQRANAFAGNLAQLPHELLRLAGQPLFDLGFILYAGAALVWFRVVAKEPLSTAYPLLVSITFLLVTLSAAALFHEPMTWRKLVGLGVVLAGILLISGG